MQKSEIIDRVAEDKESRESRQDMKKANRRTAWEDRRKVKCRRGYEDYLEDRRLKQEEGYE